MIIDFMTANAIATQVSNARRLQLYHQEWLCRRIHRGPCRHSSEYKYYAESLFTIQYAEDKDSGLNFSFKCHRDNNNVYAINAISFHPTYGTFSTAGADGTFNFWYELPCNMSMLTDCERDKDSKQRLKAFNNVGGPISSTTFNRDGRIFAYTVSYDWSKVRSSL